MKFTTFDDGTKVIKVDCASKTMQPLEAARIDMPEVMARAHRWIVDIKVLMEILDQWKSMTEDEQVQCVKAYRPVPEVAVQMPNVLVVLVDRTSTLFMDCAKIFEAPDLDDALSRVYIAPGYTGDSIQGARISSAWAHVILLCRSMAMDRYVLVETKNSIKARRRSGSQVRHEVLTIRWNAPTVKYMSQKSASEGSVRQTRGPVCEHQVREFVRHLKSGREVTVKSHVRGTPGIPRKTSVRLTSSAH